MDYNRGHKSHKAVAAGVAVDALPCWRQAEEQHISNVFKSAAIQAQSQTTCGRGGGMPGECALAIGRPVSPAQLGSRFRTYNREPILVYGVMAVETAFHAHASRNLFRDSSNSTNCFDVYVRQPVMLMSYNLIR